MSGPGYRISTEDAWPGAEKMLRQSTKSPKLSPNRSRPSPAYSYSTNSCNETGSSLVSQGRGARTRQKRKHLTGGSHLALEEDLGLQAAALLDGEHDPVRRKLHHRVLRRVGGRRGLVLGMGVGVGAEGGSERASDGRTWWRFQRTEESASTMPWTQSIWHTRSGASSSRPDVDELIPASNGVAPPRFALARPFLLPPARTRRNK